MTDAWDGVDDPHALVGAYATDALTDDERAAFETHLADCEGCRREVAEFAETLAALSDLEAAPAPVAVRAGVLDAIRNVRPLPPPARHAVSPRTPARDEGPTGSASVTRLAARRTTRVGWLLAAAALVVALAAGGGVITLQQRTGELEADRDRTLAQAEQADTDLSALMAAPDLEARPVQMSTGARGTYLYSVEQDRGVFLAPDVPPPAPGESYQLWVIADDAVASAAVVDHGGRWRIWFDGIRGAEQLAFTIEPVGGSAQPTTTPMADAVL